MSPEESSLPICWVYIFWIIMGRFSHSEWVHILVHPSLDSLTSCAAVYSQLTSKPVILVCLKQHRGIDRNPQLPGGCCWLICGCLCDTYPQFKPRFPAKACLCGQHWHMDSWAIQSAQSPVKMIQERLESLAYPGVLPLASCHHWKEAALTQIHNMIRFFFPTCYSLKT